MNYKVVKSEKIFSGMVFDVKLDLLKYDSGNDGRREVVHHNGGAVILPVNKEGKIILVKQFRYPLQKVLLEAPAGKLEINEDPRVCAVRELTEETGYRADKITPLGKIATTPGFCDEILYLFLAEELTAGEHNREEGEYGMEVFEYSIDEIDVLIKNGDLIDSKTIAALYHYKSFYLNKQ
jgi:ADP-ribose pyrophosphatase